MLSAKNLLYGISRPAPASLYKLIGLAATYLLLLACSAETESMGDRLAFITEWVDPSSNWLWKYQLFYYPATQEVEMYDIKNKRSFLKRNKCENISPVQLYIGGVVTVFTRQLKITDYGDEATKHNIESRAERTLALIKPDAVQYMGKIINSIYQSGFWISNLRLVKLSKAEAEQFYAIHRGRPFYDTLTTYMSSGRILAMELVAANAIKKWRQLIGPTDSSVARVEAPDSLRAHFGTDKTHNACHGSDAPETAQEELNFFFGTGQQQVGTCVLRQNTTLAIIKHHAIKEGLAGLILDLIQEKFAVAAMQLFTVNSPEASEFLEVYKGVVPPGEFSSMVDELTAGPCIAIEVADSTGADPVEALRELCGPMDPEIGRVLRPTTLRAQFGTSRIRNAIHCTDLPGDGAIEVSFFFDILQK